MTEKPSTPKNSKFTLDALIWWAQLVIAVLVVPIIAIAVTAAIPGGEMQKSAAFMLSCWVCVWLGMKIMGKSYAAQSKKEGTHEK